MKRFKKIGLVVAVFAVLLSSVLTTAGLVFAESSASLSIVPKKNYTIEAGKSINDTLVVRNLDNERTLNLSLRVVDFTFMDDGGTPRLMLDEEAEPTTWSMRPFMTVPKNVTIEPRSSTTVDMSVSIPENQGAGSYYSAIVYSSGSSEEGNVGLSASGVTLVFTSIPGIVDEELSIEKFGAYRADTDLEKAPGSENGGGSYKSFMTEKPLRMAFTLKNGGNVTQSPVGNITLKHMFGGQNIEITNINPNDSRALIGQTRTFINCIKLEDVQEDFNGSRTTTKACGAPSMWPGRYSASLNIMYGQNGNLTKDLVGEASFWYMPWWFIITLIVLVAAIAFGIWRITVKLKGGGAGSSKSSGGIKITRKK